MKEKILKIITDYYLNSGDFNGLPLYYFDKNYTDLICQLIDEGKVEVLSSAFVINPHIKAFRLNIDKEEQKKEVINNGDSVVLYPTEKYLKELNLNSEKPFTKMLLEGQGQLKIVFFKIEILETYFQDPRYKVFWYDYRGSIVVSDEFYDENLESEYIKDFGLGYHKEKLYEERVVGVFLGDLAELSLNAQLKWKANYLENQQDYFINDGFYKNLILGEWVDEVSICDAILDEMIIINKMCENMGIPHLFRKTYEPHTFEKPEDYRMMLVYKCGHGKFNTLKYL
ncbi:MAG: AAA family ATPase containing protein [Lachnoclostridium sp.]